MRKFNQYAPKVELNKIVKARKLLQAKQLNKTTEPSQKRSHQVKSSSSFVVSHHDRFRLPMLDAEKYEKVATKRATSGLDSEGTQEEFPTAAPSTRDYT